MAVSFCIGPQARLLFSCWRPFAGQRIQKKQSSGKLSPDSSGIRPNWLAFLSVFQNFHLFNTFVDFRLCSWLQRESTTAGHVFLPGGFSANGRKGTGVLKESQKGTSDSWAPYLSHVLKTRARWFGDTPLAINGFGDPPSENSLQGSGLGPNKSDGWEPPSLGKNGGGGGGLPK